MPVLAWMFVAGNTSGCSEGVLEEASIGASDSALVTAACPVAASISQGASGTHDGIDLAAPYNTPIFATGPGVVVASGPAEGYGQWIRIKHDDGSLTEYGHMRRRDVVLGERVRGGQQIALVGSEGRSTGPHLHLRTYSRAGDQRGIDPMMYLGARQVSLPCAPKPITVEAENGIQCPRGKGVVTGAIETKYKALGGCDSAALGVPMSQEQEASDTKGKFVEFERGVIYWTEKVGAYEVHGPLREEWKAKGAETGELGYPTTDVLSARDGRGQVSKFERGAIYSRSKTGTRSVQGKIYETWVKEGAEIGDLGYPTSSEYEKDALRRSDFERGSIVWDAKTGNTKTLAKQRQ